MMRSQAASGWRSRSKSRRKAASAMPSGCQIHCAEVFSMPLMPCAGAGGYGQGAVASCQALSSKPGCVQLGPVRSQARTFHPGPVVRVLVAAAGGGVVGIAGGVAGCVAGGGAGGGPAPGPIVVMNAQVPSSRRITWRPSSVRPSMSASTAPGATENNISAPRAIPDRENIGIAASFPHLSFCGIFAYCRCARHAPRQGRTKKGPPRRMAPTARNGPDTDMACGRLTSCRPCRPCRPCRARHRRRLLFADGRRSSPRW